MKTLLLRSLLSAVIGAIVFVGALAVQVSLVIRGVIPGFHDDPMADGLGRIPWDLIGPIALAPAALAALGMWAFMVRKQRKRMA